MRVVLVLILLVGAFLLGGWADHVYFLMPIGSAGATASSGAASAPAPAAAASSDTASASTDMRSCLAEAASRHLEPGYAQRMCRNIVNN